MKSLSLKLMTPVILSALLTANSPAFAKHHGEKAGSMHVLTSETLTKSARSDKDKARDEGRKPAAVLNFLGVKAGNTVLDVLASSGWYSEVLSVAVGNRGKVLAHNTDFLLKMRDGANEKAISARLADNRLPNVKRVDEELTALTIADNSVDVAITGLNFHDVFNSFGEPAAIGFLAAIKAKLKPGGVFGVIDHVGNADGDNKSLHRMDPALAVKAAKAAGFVVEAQGTMLTNADDDHTQGVFGPALRGKTDRFVLKLRKPK